MTRIIIMFNVLALIPGDPIAWGRKIVGCWVTVVGAPEAAND